MRKTTWMRTIALAAISMPALAFGRGPLPAGYDDATWSEEAPEARLAARAGESGAWGPAAPGYDDATYAEGAVEIRVPPMIVAAGPLPAGHDDGTYGEEAPALQARAPAQAVATASRTTEREMATRYDPTWPDGLAPGEEGEGWAAPERVRVAGTRYDATLPDGNVPGVPSPARPARIVELRVTEQGFEPAQIELRKGEAVKLVVTRTTDKTCARRIVVEGQGIDAALPLGQAVALPLVPRKSGPIRYACATGMVGGSLIVR